MPRNLATTLPVRRRARPMEEFDRLPPELRCWLHTAALPWSATSALRLWRKVWRETGGDPAAALHRLTRAEARMLARDRLSAGSGQMG